MNNELTNKTVLLIAPIYFDYEKEISKEYNNFHHKLYKLLKLSAIKKNYW